MSISDTPLSEDEYWQSMSPGQKVWSVILVTIFLAGISFIGWAITEALHGDKDNSQSTNQVHSEQ